MNFYLQKYGFCPAQIHEPPSDRLGIVVVIPCFNEPDLLASLASLRSCEQPDSDVEIITVINSGLNAPDTIVQRNQETLNEGKKWAAANSTARMRFHFIYADRLKPAIAGVGLARKIGMDEAVARFDRVGTDGIIACFDADSLCDANYLSELERHFRNHAKTPGCSVYFEHPLSGHAFDRSIYEGICLYELHLRYYRQALKLAGLPYAFHTVGSSMAVRSSAYQKQGGMNKLQAGEDFYFLHKIISLGHFTELNSTRVIPSPRVSDRVPFGTGRAMDEIVRLRDANYKTYELKIFMELRDFVARIPGMYRDEKAGSWTVSVSAELWQFLENNGFNEKLREVRANSASLETFLKRFFVWFDAFMVLKLVHFFSAGDLGIADYKRPVCEEASKLAVLLGGPQSGSAAELLNFFRHLDRGIQ